MGLSNKITKLNTEEVLKWRTSFQNLLRHKGKDTRGFTLDIRSALFSVLKQRFPFGM